MQDSRTINISRWSREIKVLNRERQLIVRTVVEISGTRRRARALIDTGAEANLVRRGWLSDEELRPARHPLTLITADGTQMAGGDKSFKGGLPLSAMLRKFPEPAELPKTGGDVESFPVEAYVADISYDMLLSYEWMAKHRLTIVPHLGCLLRSGTERAGTDMWVLGMVGSSEYGTAIRTIEVADSSLVLESIHPLSDGRLGTSADLRRIRRIQARASSNQWEVLDDQHSLD